MSWLGNIILETEGHFLTVFEGTTPHTGVREIRLNPTI